MEQDDDDDDGGGRGGGGGGGGRSKDEDCRDDKRAIVEVFALLTLSHLLSELEFDVVV